MEGYRRYIAWKAVPHNSKILQIYSRGLEYALVSKDYKQCHSFVWCKDFLHDVIYASVHNLWVDIYKFRFSAVRDPLPCLDRIRLLLTNPKDRKFSEKIPAVLDLLNQVEDRLKIKRSFVRECSSPPEAYNKSGVFMFEGSKRWIQAPPMLSLYALLLRLGFSHTVGQPFEETIAGIKSGQIRPYQAKDKKWLPSVEPALEKIFRLGDRRIFHRDIQLNYPKKLCIDTIHNRLGILGFATDMGYKLLGEPVLVPHWHYQK